MKWRKIGKIFDPTEHHLPSDCVEFAQSPQVLAFETFVRIYFSTRSIDKTNNKYVSHVAFVDMDKDLRSVIRVSERPVMSQGGLGCFDEHGIFPMSPLRHNELVYGYTCGWSRRVSVSVETAIGLAVSEDDGVTFKRVGNGPVMAASPKEPFLVGDGFVRFFEGRFHMWYIFGTSWKPFGAGLPPDRTYKIGHAVSDDGVSWTKDEGLQIIPDLVGADESQALPSVIQIDGMYHMFFCYRHSFDFRLNPSRAYKIGHAYSDDLVNWTRDDDNPSISGTPAAWDSDMQCYPHVATWDEKVYLLYNGNAFGRHGFGAAVLQ